MELGSLLNTADTNAGRSGLFDWARRKKKKRRGELKLTTEVYRGSLYVIEVEG